MRWQSFWSVISSLSEAAWDEKPEVNLDDVVERDRTRGNSRLHCCRPSQMLDTMKTLTTREFFHSPGIVKALRSGQSVIVTDNGKPALVVTKTGQRPCKSRADLEREARETCPETKP